MPHPLSENSLSSVGPNFTDKRGKIIELNDRLRSSFQGGRVQMTPSVYDLDARLRGRALAVMAKYNKFAEDSDHDCGVFIFAGYSSSGTLSTGAATAKPFLLILPMH